MTATGETLAELDNVRAVTNRNVAQTERGLIRAWASAWDELAERWRLAILELADSADDGRWPTAGLIARSERTASALAATAEALDDLARATGVEVSTRLPTLVDTSVEGHAAMLATQYPEEAGARASLVAQFGQVAPSQVRAIVQRSTELATGTLAGLPSAVLDTIARELIAGVALGDNPRVAARRMVARLDGRFSGGLGRALTIARTEMLDATRQAGALTERANASVLSGWQWVSALDDRTCPSCWAQHGTVHALDEDGPNDHPNGRCSRVPLTRSWAELGFRGISEPTSAVPSARETFDALPEADQVAIMGRRRLELVQGGQVPWEALTTPRENPAWRTSWGVTPLRDLERLAA